MFIKADKLGSEKPKKNQIFTSNRHPNFILIIPDDEADYLITINLKTNKIHLEEYADYSIQDLIPFYGTVSFTEEMK